MAVDFANLHDAVIKYPCVPADRCAVVTRPVSTWGHSGARHPK